MGWRSAVVVGVAVPVTLALTLLITYLFGYTLNRVTLFALIFSIGILVDDAIVVVENIHRHMHLPGPRRSFADVIIEAVDEVGNPTILATFAVIAAILPMAFVRGLMGPYMRPIPIGASLAMLFSLVIAFVISPWASLRIFKKEAHLPETDASGLHPADPGIEAPEPTHAVESQPELNPETGPDSWSTKLYRKVMRGLLTKPEGALGLLRGRRGAAPGRHVPGGPGRVKVKMLPFDNKSEFMVQLDLPAGTPKENALALGQDLARRLLQEAGRPRRAGLFRRGRALHVRGHGAPLLPAPGGPDGGPPGEPGAQGRPQGAEPRHRGAPAPRAAEALHARRHPGQAGGDPARPARHGHPGGRGLRPHGSRSAPATPAKCSRPSGPWTAWWTWTAPSTPPAPSSAWCWTARRPPSTASPPPTSSRPSTRPARARPWAPSTCSAAAARCPWCCSWPAHSASGWTRSCSSRCPACAGPVPLSELVTVEETVENPAIFHKNLMPVSYVFGDLAGTIESPVYALNALNKKLDLIQGTDGKPAARLGLAHPENTENLTMKWDGEWHITLEVFRDLGLAFAAVLVLIYVLVVGWFESFEIPLVILVPIPLSLIGIIPAHGLLGAFFTATSMIGFIAGAGHHRAQQHHPGGLHRAEAEGGHGAGERCGGGRRGPLPAHAPHGLRRAGGQRHHAGGPHLPGPGHQPHGRRGGRHAALPPGRARPLLPGRPPGPRRRAAAHGARPAAIHPSPAASKTPRSKP